MNRWTKTVFVVAFSVCMLLIGFWAGRCTRDKDQTVEEKETLENESLLSEDDAIPTLIAGTGEQDFGSFAHYYMDNPIDNILGKAILKATPNISMKELQELYLELWKEQYEGMMAFIRSRCIYEEDVANYEIFATQVESGFENMKPLLLNLIPDNLDEEPSHERDSWVTLHLRCRKGCIIEMHVRCCFVICHNLMDRISKGGGDTIMRG